MTFENTSVTYVSTRSASREVSVVTALAIALLLLVGGATTMAANHAAASNEEAVATIAALAIEDGTLPATATTGIRYAVPMAEANGLFSVTDEATGEKHTGHLVANYTGDGDASYAR